MSNYLPETIPFLEATSENEVAFWEHCKNKSLRFLQCADCGQICHPNVSVCPSCQSIKWLWSEAPETALLYTYTIVHHVVDELVRDYVPYNVAVVIFPDLGGLRFISNVVNIEPEELSIGMELELVWESSGDDGFIPRFKRKENP